MDCLFCAVVSSYYHVANKYDIRNSLGQQVYFVMEGQFSFQSVFVQIKNVRRKA